MKYTKMVDDGRMTVAMNGKLLEEVECFIYLGLHVVNGWMDGWIDRWRSDVYNEGRCRKGVCRNEIRKVR